jgi:hypothetical protein
MFPKPGLVNSNSGMAVFAGADNNGNMLLDKGKELLKFAKRSGHVGIKKEGVIGGGV